MGGKPETQNASGRKRPIIIWDKQQVDISGGPIKSCKRHTIYLQPGYRSQNFQRWVDKLLSDPRLAALAPPQTGGRLRGVDPRSLPDPRDAALIDRLIENEEEEYEDDEYDDDEYDDDEEHEEVMEKFNARCESYDPHELWELENVGGSRRRCDKNPLPPLSPRAAQAERFTAQQVAASMSITGGGSRKRRAPDDGSD